MKKNGKSHVPAPGRSTGLRGEALCGRMASYGTGDHALIRSLAIRGEGDWCSTCLAKLPEGVR